MAKDFRHWEKVKINKQHKIVSWSDFENDIPIILEEVSKKTVWRTFWGIYGVPKGGLPLAVKLSNKLGIPLLLAPIDNCLIVDDIYDSGITIVPLYKKFSKTCMFIVWFVDILKSQECKDKGITAIRVKQENDWLVFPWE